MTADMILTPVKRYRDRDNSVIQCLHGSYLSSKLQELRMLYTYISHSRAWEKYGFFIRVMLCVCRDNSSHSRTNITETLFFILYIFGI